MDKEHIKGAADKAKGAVKDAFGKMTDDKKMQAEGKIDKAKGAAHEALGDVKDAGRKAQRQAQALTSGNPGKAAQRAAFFLHRERAMQPDKSTPAIDKPPPGDKDEKTNQAQAQSDTEPFDAESEFAARVAQGGGRFEDEDRRGEDAATTCRWTRRLGNPGWERSAADGRLDVPDEDDE